MPSKNKSKGKTTSKEEVSETKGASEDAVETTEEAAAENVADADGAKAESPKETPKEAPKETPASEPQSQAEVIQTVLEKLGLSSTDIKAEEKVETLCVILNETLINNVQMKDTIANLNGQLEKHDMTKAALQKLCDALKTQVHLKDEENTLKLQEETQKRIEIAKNFETTMGELTKLIEDHSKHNQTLKEENVTMAKRLEELLQEYEKRENKIASISEEFNLKEQLHAAQLAKAKIEKAELNADFNKERLLLQKELLESKKDLEVMLQKEDNMKEQIELYAAQYNDLSKGTDEKKSNFGQFKSQVDKMNKRLKNLEVDSSMWKDKFEESNEIVVKLNSKLSEANGDLESTKKKLVAMEKLNRTLASERAALMKEKNGTQNGT